MVDFKLGKWDEFLGYAILTESGYIHVDEEGDWFLVGNRDSAGIAVFGIREDAKRVAKKLKRRKNHNFTWTRTIPVFFIEPK